MEKLKTILIAIIAVLAALGQSLHIMPMPSPLKLKAVMFR